MKTLGQNKVVVPAGIVHGWRYGCIYFDKCLNNTNGGTPLYLHDRYYGREDCETQEDINHTHSWVFRAHEPQ